MRSPPPKEIAAASCGELGPSAVPGSPEPARKVSEEALVEACKKCQDFVLDYLDFNRNNNNNTNNFNTNMNMNININNDVRSSIIPRQFGYFQYKESAYVFLSCTIGS